MAAGRTDQEEFWSGEFGNLYSRRNDDRNIVAANIQLFAQALRGLRIDSVLEVGANIGLNLAALRALYPSLEMSAIEINAKAAAELRSRFDGLDVENCSIGESTIEREFDLVISKGVLIHLDPNDLSNVYSRIRDWSSKFVLFVEYFSPTPVTVSYRGHEKRLFKRDFAGEFLEMNSRFQLRDYGFVYHGDRAHPLDDVSWFLMEKIQ